jgi:DNA polymerase-4
MSVLEAKLKLPKAVYVNGNYDKYLHNTKILMQICERYSDVVEVYSVDEAFIDMTHTAKIFGTAAIAAATLQDEIQRTLRVTCSVGVAPSKLMAKMASEFNKPAGLTVFESGDLPEVLFPLLASDIPGVGRRMKKHLDAIGIKTIGHLAATPVELLRDKFGIIGELLHGAANGIDDSPVIATHQGMDVKSFGQSISLGKGSSDVDYLYDILLGLCEGATRRMRKDGYLGKTVSVYMLLGRVFGVSRQASLTGHTDLPGKIFKAAKHTLSFLLDQRTSLDMYPVTKIGIGVTKLTRRDMGRQMCVFDLLDEREAALVSTTDALKNKFGDKAITRCSLLGLRGRYMGVPRSELGIF